MNTRGCFGGLTTSARALQAGPNAVPIAILKEGATYSRGRTAMANNIAAARLICEVVRTSLGPHGMDKMLINDQDVVTITNDGATMLKEMRIQHPAAKILAEVSKATDTGVGDGTTSAVVFAGALLERADELLKKGIHPMIVATGFAKAGVKAREILDTLSIGTDPTDRESLEKVARTSLQSKIVSRSSLDLAKVVVDAVLRVATKESDGRYRVDVKNIKIEKKMGRSMADTICVQGIVLDQKVVYPGMKRKIEKAKIALVNLPFEIKTTQMSTMITISEASQIPKFIEEQNVVLKSMVDKLSDLGVSVVVCQKPIDEIAQHYMAQAGILAVQKAYEIEMPNIARATGARVITHLADLTEGDLGYADLVEERKVDESRLLFIEGTKNPKSVTILIRGGTKRVIEEAERSIHDAIMVVRDTLQQPELVVGGGATEAEVACQLMRWADQLEGREQFAVLKYAEALEQIPIVLAQNAGMDGINTATELRAKHADGGRWYGIPKTGRKLTDMRKEDVLEPLMVKQQVLKSATEAASMLLRIDNIIMWKPDRRPHTFEAERAEAIAEGVTKPQSPSELAEQT